MRGGAGGSIGLAALALVGACATATGKLYDQVNVDGGAIRVGMSAAEVTRLLGRPDFVSTTGHHFANRFGSAAGEIEAGWDEWAYSPTETETYVVYLSGGTVRKVGIFWDSPVSRSDGLCAMPLGAGRGSYSIVRGISVVNDS